MLHVWRDTQNDIKGLAPEIAKFKNTVKEVIFPPFGNGAELQFIILRNKIN